MVEISEYHYTECALGEISQHVKGTKQAKIPHTKITVLVPLIPQKDMEDIVMNHDKITVKLELKKNTFKL